MREQEHTNRTDQGWATMRQLLDREMPRRRRRPAGWWATALVLLPVLGLAGWYWQQEQLHNTSANPSTPSLPLAQHPALPIANQLVEAQGMVTIDQPATQPEIQYPSIERTKAGSSPRQPVSPGTFAIQLPNSELQNLPAQPPVEVFSALSLQDEQTIATNSDRITVLPERVPALIPVPVSNLFNRYPAYARTVIKPAKHASQWAYGLALGISSDRLPRINGGLTGAVVDWQVSRHFGLRSGLHYEVQRLASDELLVTTISEAAYRKISYQVGLYDPNYTYSVVANLPGNNVNILASVRRIHRLEVPAIAYWQPLPALRGYIGSSLNYTFLAQTSSRIFADNQVYRVVRGRDELNKLATDRLNKWQVKWQAGVGYRIGKRIEFNGFLQAALPKISFQKTKDVQDIYNGPHYENTAGYIRQLNVKLSGAVFF